MKSRYLVVIFQLIFAGIALGQVGSISGKVTESERAEPIPFAKVMIEGQSKGAVTDLDGNFLLNGLKKGIYSLTISATGYNTKIISSISVSEGVVTTLSVSLDAVVKEIGPITITVTLNKETNENLIKMQRMSAGQVDGISQETIKRSPDRDASAVLKRVSGASIQDNKFIIIRGLNDRYNTALINGLPLPSTEADRKAFSFDIFPSVMLDNMLIYKTASPDLPGDFAGGVIQVNTKEMPDKNYLTFTAGGNCNSQSTFKEYATSQGSSKDWMGLGTKDRVYPADLPNTATFKELLANSKTRFENSTVFSNDWGIANRSSAPLGQNYQFGFARSKPTKKGTLGVVGGMTYNYNQRYLAVTRKDYNDDSSRVFEYKDDTYRQIVTWGGMLNLFYKINENNKLSFKNLVSDNSINQTILRSGENIDADQLIKATAIQYTSSKLLTSQMNGEHILNANNLKLRWGLNYGKTITDIPNLKRMLYYKNRTPQGTISDSVYTAYVPFGSPSPDFAGKFFSKLKEDLYSVYTDVTIPYTFLKEKSSFKIGYAGSYKTRSFDARVFGYAVNNPAQFNYNLLYLPQDSIFSNNNIGPKGFKLGESTNPSDSYSATTNLQAGYVMTDQKIGQKLRMVYGMRTEYFNQKLHSMSYGGDSINIDRSTLSFLPSMNATYSFSKKMNVRGAVSRTVARPDFRELAPFSFYDFNTSSAVVGNDTLHPANITNLDLRFEYFPGNGQLFSVSTFYKDFKNPIENTVFFGGSGSRTYTFKNVAGAVDYGLEVEFRTKLSKIDSLFHSNRLDNFTLYTNLTLVKSIVDLSNVATAVTQEEKYRPMQGQSPYLINGGLIYQNEEKGFGASILFNRIGRRIAFVGTNGYQDIYENPRNVLDIQISKRIFKHGEIKLNASDIFNQKAIFYQDFNHSKKYEATNDKVINGIRYGRTLSFSFAYSF